MMTELKRHDSGENLDTKWFKRRRMSYLYILHSILQSFSLISILSTCEESLGLSFLVTHYWISGQDHEVLETLGEDAMHSNVKRKNNLKYLQIIIKQSLPAIIINIWVVISSSYNDDVQLILLISYVIVIVYQVRVVILYAISDELDTATSSGMSLRMTLMIKSMIELMLVVHPSSRLKFRQMIFTYFCSIIQFIISLLFSYNIV